MYGDYSKGPFSKVSSLPIGTTFHVVNGNWEGEIFEKNGQRYLKVINTDSEYLLTPDYDPDLVIQIIDEQPCRDVGDELCF